MSNALLTAARATSARAYACDLCNESPCDCDRHDHPAQRRIVAAIWALREAIAAWHDTDSPGHPAECRCEWCTDAAHLAYVLCQQNAALMGEMLSPPDRDESCRIVASFIRELARERRQRAAGSR
jgi:hypothetical protein